MADASKRYFDERFEKVYHLIDTFAASVTERFDQVAERFDQVDKRFDDIETKVDRIDGRLMNVETNTELVARDHRELRSLVEDNVVPRIENLESERRG